MDRDNANLKARAFTDSLEGRREEERRKEKLLVKYVGLQRRIEEERLAASEAMANVKFEVHQITLHAQVVSMLIL